jgi:hypothetical protein
MPKTLIIVVIAGGAVMLRPKLKFIVAGEDLNVGDKVFERTLHPHELEVLGPGPKLPPEGAKIIRIGVTRKMAPFDGTLQSRLDHAFLYGHHLFVETVDKDGTVTRDSGVYYTRCQSHSKH